MQIKEFQDFISEMGFVGATGVDPDTEGWEALRKQQQRFSGAAVIREAHPRRLGGK